MAKVEVFTLYQLDRIQTLARAVNNSKLYPPQEVTKEIHKGFGKVIFSLREDLRSEGLADIAQTIIFPAPLK